MAEDIKMKFVGDGADGERAIAQLERKFEGLENRMKRLNEVSKQTSKQGAAGFDAMGTAVGNATKHVSNMYLGMAGVGKLLDGLKAGMADLEERAGKAGQAIRGLAPSQEAANFNAGPEAAKRMNDEAKRISDRLGVPIEAVNKTMSSVMSAKGALPEEAAFKTARAGHELFRLNPEMAQTFAGASLDLQQVAGKDVTPEDTMGFIQGVGQKSRVENPELLAKNIIPAVTNLVRLDEGRNFRENAALAATLTQLTGDQTGASSATTATALNIQLEEFMPGKQTNAERQQALRNDPKLRDAFLKGLKETTVGPDGQPLNIGSGGASFETKFKPAIRDFLTAGTGAEKTYRDAFAGIPEIEAGDKVFAGLLEANAKSPALQKAYADQSAQVKLQNFYGNNDRAHRQHVLQQQLEEVPQAAGVPLAIRAFGSARRFANSMDNWMFGRGMDETELGVKHAESMLSLGKGAGLDNQAIELLQQSVDTLKQLAADGKRTAENTKPQPGLAGQVEAGANQ